MGLAEADAVALVEQLRGEPPRAYVELAAEAAATTDGAVQAICWRGAGEAARWVTSVADSAELLGRAVRAADRAGRADLRAAAMVTLSGTQHMAGDVDGALATLAAAADGAVGLLAAKVAFQRATIMAREGRTDEARAAYDLGLPLFEEAGERFFVAATLGNRAMIRLDRGDAGGAMADLRRAQALFDELGIGSSAAWMEHNIGRAAGRAGDVPGALTHFRLAEQRLVELGLDPSEVQVNRCEVLVEAGLYAEAESVSRATIDRLAGEGRALERAEAGYYRALALLGQDDTVEAAREAADAARQFRDQNRSGWALAADALAGAASPGGDQPDPDLAAAVAEELASMGQLIGAAQAWALLGRWAPQRAAVGLAALPWGPVRPPFEARLATLVVGARAALAGGDDAAARRLSARAIDLGDHRRRLAGAAELRAAVSAQLAGVAEVGLRARLGRHRPADVLRWVDRCRTSGSPAAHHRAAGSDEDIAALRALQVAARTASPADLPSLLRRQSALQRRIVASTRRAAHRPARSASRRPRLVLGEFGEATIVQHHVLDSRVGAVVVHRGRAELHRLGALDDIHEHATHLARAYRRLALAVGGGHSTGDALVAVARRVEALQRLLLPPIPGDRVVVAPLARHATIPWAAMPALAGAEVAVSHRLSHWLTGERSGARLPARVAVLGGPDLSSAAAELAAVGAAWADRAAVTADATVGDLRAALDGADLLHLACHGERRAHDGRFAQLRMTDGDLVAVEIEQLARTPATVVLAACDAGALEALRGDESAGLVEALLGAGTATVLAAATLLPDHPTTVELIGALHRRLAAGTRPAAALREVRATPTDAAGRWLAGALTCFGWG